MEYFSSDAHPVSSYGRTFRSLPPRYLPEGVISLNPDWIGGVQIQHGQDSPRGALWFHCPSSLQTVGIPLSGRPGFFRPIYGEDRVFVVGMDRRLVLVTVDIQRGSCTEEVLASVPDELFDDNPAMMCNDGTVDPGGRRIVFGLKDPAFGTGGNTGIFLTFDQSSGFKVINTGEVCPNGNAFVKIDSAVHLLHIETKSQQMLAFKYDPDTGQVDTPRTCFSFAEPANFPPELFHPALMPDGLCHWTVANGGPNRDKVIVAVFDYRAGSEIGQAFQFDVTDGVIRFEGVYRFPGSPRVTCPALHNQSGRPLLYFTTASEGLFEARGEPDISRHPHVGTLFSCGGEYLATRHVSPPVPFQLG